MRYCLQCATKLPDDEKSTCPQCGRVDDPAVTKRLLGFAEFVMIGSRYSIPFYQDMSSDDEFRCFTPDLTEVAKYIALAVVSGVVGNLATDGVKSLVSHLRKQAGTRVKHSSLQDDLSDDPERLIEQASAFFRMFPALSETARTAVLEELLVHHMQDVINTHRKRAKPLSKEEVAAARRDAYESASDLLRIAPIHEMQTLWSTFREASAAPQDDTKDD